MGASDSAVPNAEAAEDRIAEGRKNVGPADDDAFEAEAVADPLLSAGEAGIEAEVSSQLNTSSCHFVEPVQLSPHPDIETNRCRPMCQSMQIVTCSS